jgi:hypothetical protein
VHVEAARKDQTLMKAMLAYFGPCAQGTARLSEELGWVGLRQKGQCSHSLPECALVVAQCGHGLLP